MVHKFQSHDEFDIVQILLSICFGLSDFVLLFAPCEMGERLGNLFIKFDVEIGQMNWYLFPIDIQKVLPIVMINTQQPVLIEFFGSIACTRSQFKKVNPNLNLHKVAIEGQMSTKR